VQCVPFPLMPNSVRCIDRACPDAEVDFVMEGQVRDYFAFSFVSPETTDYDCTRHFFTKQVISRGLYKIFCTVYVKRTITPSSALVF
jgi:hypothetical protein